MGEEKQNPCPTCQGKKIIEGECQSSSEWSTPDNEDGMQCTPPTTCPTCNGTGVEKSE
jgi:hypothetical protein